MYQLTYFIKTTHTHTHTHTYIHTYIHIYTHTHIYIYIYIYICVCVCVCVCVCTHANGYIHTPYDSSTHFIEVWFINMLVVFFGFIVFTAILTPQIKSLVYSTIIHCLSYLAILYNFNK